MITSTVDRLCPKEPTVSQIERSSHWKSKSVGKRVPVLKTMSKRMVCNRRDQVQQALISFKPSRDACSDSDDYFQGGREREREKDREQRHTQKKEVSLQTVVFLSIAFSSSSEKKAKRRRRKAYLVFDVFSRPSFLSAPVFVRLHPIYTAKIYRS